MKKFTMILCICIIASAFAFMFVFSVFFTRTTVSDYSYLYEWPEFSVESLLSGKYFKGITNYFTDTINSRDRFVDFEASIRSLYGIEEDNQLIENDFGEEPNESLDSSLSTPENITPDSSNQENNSDVIIEGSEFENSYTEDSSAPESDNSTENSEPSLKAEISKDVLIVGNRAMEIFYGNLKQAAIYADVLNNFAEQLDPSVNVYSMVIPKVSAYYIGQVEGYSHLASRNKDNIDAISNALSDRVIDVNIYNILGVHANEPIYLRTDHHWSALGAYYGATVFANKAGVDMALLEDYTKEVRPGYVGTMYKYTGYHPTVLNNPEDFVVYYPNADYTATYYSATDLTSNERKHDGGFFWKISDEQKSSWYSTFLRGDSYSVKAISNECKNGRKLLIVKDSYGNTLAPYLLEGFEEIYIVDARKYERSLSETIEEYGITDVLFAECALSAVGSNYIKDLKEICK